LRFPSDGQRYSLVKERPSEGNGKSTWERADVERGLVFKIKNAPGLTTRMICDVGLGPVLLKGYFTSRTGQGRRPNNS
tara:strand:+ start:751 stop:984 length:234 start_codon:yes stop_codon:yes gene_type:complete